MNKEKIKGYVLGIIGGAAYGTNPLFAKPLYETGLDASSVVFYRYLIAVIFVFLLAQIKGVGLKSDRKSILIAIGLGLMVVGSSLALFHAYNYMGVGVASTILYVYPIMVASILIIFFKEQLTLRTGVCILLALIGVTMLYINGEGMTLSTTGTILSLISALTYAIYMVCINKSRIRNMNTIALTFYVLVFGLVIYIPLEFCGYPIMPLTDRIQLLYLIGVALLPTVISFICTASAILKIGSTATAILGALEPLTAVIIGIAIFGEELTTRSVFGMTLVMTAVLIIITSKEKK